MRPGPNPRKSHLVRHARRPPQRPRLCGADRRRVEGAGRRPARRGGARPTPRRLVLLTFLAIGRARDCILALSDRMESVAQSDPNEVTKYYLCDAGGFYLALSGDARMAKDLLSELGRLQPSGADVFREIDRLAAESYLARRAGNVAGHLIVASDGEFKVYTVSIIFGITVFAECNDAVQAEGDSGGTAVCRNLALDMPLADMPCEAAVKCLHSMAGRIAETVDSVGDGGKYGFDVVVFSKSGAVTELRRRTDRMGSIRVSFEAADTGPLLGPDGGA